MTESIECDECDAQFTASLASERVGLLLDHYADEHPDHPMWQRDRMQQ